MVSTAADILAIVGLSFQDLYVAPTLRRGQPTVSDVPCCVSDVLLATVDAIPCNQTRSTTRAFLADALLLLARVRQLELHSAPLMRTWSTAPRPILPATMRAVRRKRSGPPESPSKSARSVPATVPSTIQITSDPSFASDSTANLSPAIPPSPGWGWRTTEPNGSGNVRRDGDRAWYRDEIAGVWRDRSVLEIAAVQATLMVRAEQIFHGPDQDGDLSANSDQWKVRRGSLSIARALFESCMGSYRSVEQSPSLPENRYVPVTRGGPRRIDLTAVLIEEMNPDWGGTLWACKVLGDLTIADEYTFRPIREAFSPTLQPVPHLSYTGGIQRSTPNVRTDEVQDAIGPEKSEILHPTYRDVAMRILDRNQRRHHRPGQINPKMNNQFELAVSEGRCAVFDSVSGAGKSHSLCNIVNNIEWSVVWSDVVVFVIVVLDPERLDFLNSPKQTGIVMRYHRSLDRVFDRASEIAAEGGNCVLIMDEAQLLERRQIERLDSFAQIVLLGDQRQSSGENVVPPPAFVLASYLQAEVSVPRLTWRFDNPQILRMISYVGYGGVFDTPGRFEPEPTTTLFEYDLCRDEPETVAARLWAYTRRHLKGDPDESLMVVCDHEATSMHLKRLLLVGGHPETGPAIRVGKRDELQGTGADVVLFVAADFMNEAASVQHTLKEFLTFMGRAKRKFAFIGVDTVGEPNFNLFGFLLNTVCYEQLEIRSHKILDVDAGRCEELKGTTVVEVGLFGLVRKDGCNVGVLLPLQAGLSLDQRWEVIQMREFLKSRGWPTFEWTDRRTIKLQYNRDNFMSSLLSSTD